MFTHYSTETLVSTRNSLLKGLDRVAETITAGTFHKVGSKGQAPPSQSGQLTLMLLVEINHELVGRGLPTVFVG